MSNIPSLFNVNASIGCSTTSHLKPSFRSADDLLKHMNRLGVERSLVWCMPDIWDTNLNRNEEMLMEIDSIPQAAQRLIPAYSVTPLAAYVPKCVEGLKKSMASGRVKAIRIVLGGAQDRLSPIEPLIREVSQYKPVILINSKEPHSNDDFLAFLEKFPELPMVYLLGLWPDMGAMFDMLHRRDNLYLDTSWLVMPGFCEQVVEKYGAEKLIYGFGLKSNNGASLAQLMHAKISDSDRELIGHKNLERLLGIKELDSTIAAKIKPGGERKNLYAKLLRGETLEAGIIDSHAHMEYSEEISDLYKNMKKLGIDTLIASGWQALASNPVKGNLDLSKNSRQYGGQLLGYLTYNPEFSSELLPRLDEFFADPFFVGIKILNSYWRIKITDPVMDPVWEYADRHNLPILVHTWDGDYNSPAMLKDIVKKYKNAIFILGHSGGLDGGRTEAEELAEENPNVILEFCGSFLSNILWEDTVKRLGNKKILFGTDATAHTLEFELGRFLSMDLPDETLIPMLGENMWNIMAMRK